LKRWLTASVLPPSLSLPVSPLTPLTVQTAHFRLINAVARTAPTIEAAFEFHNQLFESGFERVLFVRSLLLCPPSVPTYSPPCSSFRRPSVVPPSSTTNPSTSRCRATSPSPAPPGSTLAPASSPASTVASSRHRRSWSSSRSSVNSRRTRAVRAPRRLAPSELLP
jgi:hypothetical protein